MDKAIYFLVKSVDEGCNVLIPNDTATYDIIQTIFTVIRIAVPILLIVLIAKDLLTATTAGKEDEMKKAQASAIKRIIIAVIIFFLPSLINLIAGLAGITGTCGIG